MSLIQNIVEKPFTIEFDVSNESGEANTSLVNAIRRTIMTDIETWVMNPEETTFFENTSILDNEFISHRLSLIPIRNNVKDMDYENVVIELRKKNEEDEVISVYVEDFQVKVNGEVVENSVLFAYPKILLLKLRYQQSIAFESKLMRGSVENGDSSIHCPVCTCVHTFVVNESAVKEKTKDMSEEEKKSFFTNDVQREYGKNARQEPKMFHIVVESIGQFEAREIVKMGIQLLKKRIQDFIRDLKGRAERITIENGEVYEDIINISVENETDTLGNMISMYLNRKENVAYSGYVIRHPLQKNILFRVKLSEENTVDEIIKNYETVCQEIQETLDTMLAAF
jgi:DNA-directed RNA polymerase subunit L